MTDHTAIRGPFLTFHADPFTVDPIEAVTHQPDGLILCKDGIITAVGAWDDLKAQIPQGITVDHYPNHLISAGMVDTHVHYHSFP